jgi:ribosomal protein L19E
MKLERKKEFIAKVLGIGKGRVVLNKSRLADIKEAMTRQDIVDLLNDNAIFIREIKGRKAIEKRTTRRRAGSIRLPVKNSKRKYIILTRKFRNYISELLKNEKLNKEQYLKLRREIRASAFKSKSHLKERLKLLK